MCFACAVCADVNGELKDAQKATNLVSTWYHNVPFGYFVLHDAGEYCIF